MVMSEEQERVKTLLEETIVLLCKNGINFKSCMKIDGLIGITYDEDNIFLINLHQMISCGNLSKQSSQCQDDPCLMKTNTSKSTDYTACDVVYGSQVDSSPPLMQEFAYRGKRRRTEIELPETTNQDLNTSWLQKSSSTCRDIAEPGSLSVSEIECAQKKRSRIQERRAASLSRQDISANNETLVTVKEEDVEEDFMCDSKDFEISMNDDSEPDQESHSESRSVAGMKVEGAEETNNETNFPGCSGWDPNDQEYYQPAQTNDPPKVSVLFLPGLFVSIHV